MAKQDKDLLLCDISARLPYHPILNWKFLDNTSRDDELKDLSDLNIWWITKAKDCEVRPYLRPLSSMSEEERKEAYEYFGINLLHTHGDINILQIPLVSVIPFVDWLNKHHFDYRGLIEKGLALEAPEGMYKNK